MADDLEEKLEDSKYVTVGELGAYVGRKSVEFIVATGKSALKNTGLALVDLLPAKYSLRIYDSLKLSEEDIKRSHAFSEAIEFCGGIVGAITFPFKFGDHYFIAYTNAILCVGLMFDGVLRSLIKQERNRYCGSLILEGITIALDGVRKVYHSFEHKAIQEKYATRSGSGGGGGN